MDGRFYCDYANCSKNYAYHKGKIEHERRVHGDDGNSPLVQLVEFERERLELPDGKVRFSVGTPAPEQAFSFNDCVLGLKMEGLRLSHYVVHLPMVDKCTTMGTSVHPSKGTNTDCSMKSNKTSETQT